MTSKSWFHFNITHAFIWDILYSALINIQSIIYIINSLSLHKIFRLCTVHHFLANQQLSYLTCLALTVALTVLGTVLLWLGVAVARRLLSTTTSRTPLGRGISVTCKNITNVQSDYQSLLHVPSLIKCMPKMYLYTLRLRNYLTYPLALAVHWMAVAWGAWTYWQALGCSGQGLCTVSLDQCNSAGHGCEPLARCIRDLQN